MTTWRVTNPIMGRKVLITGKSGRALWVADRINRLMEERNSIPLSELPAPKYVHLDMADDCSLRCNGCYLPFGEPQHKLAPLDEYLRAIDDIAASPVQYVTMGGGEPTESPYFVPLANRLGDHRMPYGITTNGLWAKDWSKDDPRYPGLSSAWRVAVSWYGEAQAAPAVAALREMGVPHISVNYISPFSRFERSAAFEMLRRDVEAMKRAKVEIITILHHKDRQCGSPKGSGDPVASLALQTAMTQFRMVEVDCLTAGRCDANRAFVTVGPNLDVLSCSFWRQTWGNLREEPLTTIWARMKEAGAPFAVDPLTSESAG